MIFFYILDGVFEPKISDTLFEETVAPILSENQSCTIILYGYSGTGKTYSIFGQDGIPGILNKSIEMMKRNVGGSEMIS